MTKQTESFNLDILTKSHMPQVILAVGKEKLVNFSAITTFITTIKGATNSTTIKARLNELAELKLLEMKPIPNTSRKEHTYHAYPLLEQLASKLSYVFDENIELLPIKKDGIEYQELMRRLKHDNLTLEQFIAQKIREYLGE